MQFKATCIAALLFLIAATETFSQSRLSKNEISINAFRNPSIGLEYRYKNVSVHGGYYITALESGVTTKFLKFGWTGWFLPVGKKENPSSFYVGASYLRGLNLEYKGDNAMATEAGFRWMVWKGLNLRIGGILLISKDHKTRLNPTPSINYSFFF